MQGQRRLRFPLRFLLLVGLVLAGGALALRQGWLPAALLPLPPLDLAEPAPWLLDWRLARLRRSPELCRATLKAPAIDATAVADQPISNGCGWENSVRVASAGGARVAIDKLSCPAAAGLALWLTHAVQPAAKAHLGSRVTSLRHFGGYACRNIAGSAYLRSMRSEHATANAIDLAAFGLADGRSIGVLQYWSREGPEARFLHEVHGAACRYFRVVLGPAFNKEHRDHFHLDRGPMSVCR